VVDREEGYQKFEATPEKKPELVSSNKKKSKKKTLNFEKFKSGLKSKRKKSQKGEEEEERDSDQVVKKLNFEEEEVKEGTLEVETEVNKDEPEESPKPKKKKKKKKKAAFAFIKKNLKKKKQKSTENSNLTLPKSQEADNSAISSSSNIKNGPQNLLENSMNKTLETIQRELNRDPKPESKDSSQNMPQSKEQDFEEPGLNQQEKENELVKSDQNQGNLGNSSGDPELNLEIGNNSNILDEINQIDQHEKPFESEEQKPENTVPTEELNTSRVSQEKEVPSDLKEEGMQSPVMSVPGQGNGMFSQSSMERNVTAEVEEENEKLEKLLYKLKGDFRSKILREKNIKIWKEYYNFFKTEFEFILDFENVKKQQMNSLNELAKENTEVEQKMIESLENEDLTKTDEYQVKLSEMEELKKTIQKEIDSNDQKEEEFQSRGSLLLIYICFWYNKNWVVKQIS
jgi:hypothetical protein